MEGKELLAMDKNKSPNRTIKSGLVNQLRTKGDPNG